MDFSEETARLLDRHGLRTTLPRTGILHLFLQAGVALSQPEIERSLRDSCDRVTIYRTLSSFMEKGILHKVLDDEGAMKYALCPPACNEAHNHRHDHVHFKCVVCGNTNCINEVVVPALTLPAGFQLQEVNILLQGVCSQCAAATQSKAELAAQLA